MHETSPEMSVGVLAFDRVLQHRASLRVDSDFVLRGVMENDEGVAESAATGFLLEFLRDYFARISPECGHASIGGLYTCVPEILLAVQGERGSGQESCDYNAEQKSTICHAYILAVERVLPNAEKLNVGLGFGFRFRRGYRAPRRARAPLRDVRRSRRAIP